MKYSLLLLLFVAISNSIFSQDYNKVYYNSNWEITSKKHAAYYRVSGFDAGKMAFDSITNDYYISGKPEMIGFYKSGMKNGSFIYYFPNGQISLKSEYHNNNRAGTWIEYYKNGIVKREVKYQQNKELLVQYNDSMGASFLNNKNCSYHLNYKSNSYFDSNKALGVFGGIDSYKMAGKIKNGQKDGTWVIKKNGSLYCKVKYENGTFTRGYLILIDSKLPIVNDEIARLIPEPEKLKVTEGLFLEQGQMIRRNYILAALQMRREEGSEKVELGNKKELVEYFNNNFSKYTTDCNDTVRFSVRVKTDDAGAIKSFSLSPDVPSTYRDEVSRVLSGIHDVNQFHNSEISFSYRVLCVDELDFKK